MSCVSLSEAVPGVQGSCYATVALALGDPCTGFGAVGR